MRLTGVHIAVLLGLIVVGLVVYGSYRYQQPGTAQPAGGSETGLLPPVVDGVTLAPKLVVEPEKVLDLGVIPRTGQSPGVIKLHNQGNAPLEITRVNASCGCTAAKIDEKQKIIPPGGVTEVQVTVDPKRIAGFEAKKSVTIMSNDQAHARYDVEVWAKIDPEFAVDPPQLFLGKVRKGIPVEKTILLRQLSDELIEVKDVKSNSSDLQVSFARRPEDQWAAPGKPEFEIKVRLSEDTPLGPFNGRFAIVSTCSRLPSYWYTVRADVDSFYSVTPTRPLILRPDAKQPAVITFTGKLPFEIIAVEQSTPDIVVTKKPDAGANVAIYEVTLKQPAPEAFKNEWVMFTLKSNDETVRERIVTRLYGGAPIRPGRSAQPLPEGAKLPSLGPGRDGKRNWEGLLKKQTEMMKPGEPAPNAVPMPPNAPPRVPPPRTSPVSAPAAPGTEAAPAPEPVAK